MAYLRSISAISERISLSLVSKSASSLRSASRIMGSASALLASAPIIVFIHRIRIKSLWPLTVNLELFRKLCILGEGRALVRPPARARPGLFVGTRLGRAVWGRARVVVVNRIGKSAKLWRKGGRDAGPCRYRGACGSLGDQ